MNGRNDIVDNRLENGIIDKQQWGKWDKSESVENSRHKIVVVLNKMTDVEIKRSCTFCEKFKSVVPTKVGIMTGLQVPDLIDWIHSV